MLKQPELFICYSHRDRAWKDRLLTHLRPLERANLVRVWHDGEIGAGLEWINEIETALQSARVAVLLVSADFLGSDFILRKEIPTILQRRSAQDLTAIPVIVRSCLWEQITWLSTMQVRPLYGKPLAAHRGNQRDTQLSAIAAEVLRLLQPPIVLSGDESPVRNRSAGSPVIDSPATSVIAPLEDNVDILLHGAQLISTLEGFVLNSGRILERYLELVRLRNVHLGHARFVVPSTGAIRAAYKSRPRNQQRYLVDTVRHIKAAWERLQSQGLLDRVEFRRIDCVPRNMCVIRNQDLVLTGLYEQDQSHPLGFTCSKSWLHSPSNDSGQLCQAFSEWFNLLWEESTPMS